MATINPGHAKRGLPSASVQGTLAKVIGRHPWNDRGFSERSIDALLGAGYRYPEELLFADRSVVVKAQGVGKAVMAEVDAYRAKFIPGAPPGGTAL